jgi:rhodanese-related sulfurtransferase
MQLPAHLLRTVPVQTSLGSAGGKTIFWCTARRLRLRWQSPCLKLPFPALYFMAYFYRLLMPIQKLAIQDFLQLAQTSPVFDVRSPGEYDYAHIPGAYNLPLFTDEERKVVGTAYKQQGKQPAIKIGLDYFGVKMKAIVEVVEDVVSLHLKSKSLNTPVPTLGGGDVLVHCWRGGMRSAGIAWLLDLYGFIHLQEVIKFIVNG